jgi:hypothetical protein
LQLYMPTTHATLLKCAERKKEQRAKEDTTQTQSRALSFTWPKLHPYIYPISIQIIDLDRSASWAVPAKSRRWYSIPDERIN